ncbi:N-acetylmuramoyl-L-alanine amidase [Burkholderia ubonensis subsp. mesacidophila]|uniref:N-acetylmuramoyl-L-alanine amidase n=1 Tax=Burkholderia ubonensis subsp. mesacidophila TaxID=265293 RepID=A0A2A4FBN4_9BURK|nr:N-acetylmuramoyl-L-alanine amidase [Burkholderia ubonensis subsp. mesacidophila]
MFISKQGHVDAERIKVKIFSTIERGQMSKVNGIVVHQTDGTTASSSFNSYAESGANGAHFLIDKNGAIYQTASVYKRTNHVGLLKSRCLVEKKCSPSEFKRMSHMAGKYKKLSGVEYRRGFPDRYPGNADSIGIEIVGRMDRETEIYEVVNDKQNESLRWLVKELCETLGVSVAEIYKHPEVSYKKETEASTEKWE